MITAVLSLVVWLFLGDSLLSRIRRDGTRMVTGLAFYTLLANYCFLQFVSYYLQCSYFNQQFFFHVSLDTLREGWRAYPLLFLLFWAWMSAIWLTLWWTRDRLRAISVSGLGLASLVLVAVLLDPGLRRSHAFTANLLVSPDISSQEIDWEALNLNREAVKPLRETLSGGRNLVLVFLEGFDRIYTDETLFPGLTPNIQNLNATGWQLTGLSPVKGSAWTMGGLVSSLCGTPLSYEFDVAGNSIMFSRLLDQARCLPDVLRDAGYNQTFMGGASLNFAGKGNFLRTHSYDPALGIDELRDRLAPGTSMGGWGLHDDSLFELAYQEFERLAGLGRPFNLTLLTVDTHHPTGEPSPSCQPYQEIDNSILHAVHCTDYLLGIFIGRLRNHPAFKDTLVVLTADHLAMRNNAFELFPEGYQRRLYFNVLNSTKAGTADVYATPLDIAPTVLSLLDIRHRTAFLAGIDVSELDTRYPPANDYNGRREQTIRYINSNLLSSNLESNGPLLFDLADARLEDINFINQIEDASLADGILSVQSSGNDPYFILPDFKRGRSANMEVRLSVEVPVATSFALFYTTPQNRSHSAEQRVSASVVPGINNLILLLPDDATPRNLRIDPGTAPGPYTISSIEIR